MSGTIDKIGAAVGELETLSENLKTLVDILQLSADEINYFTISATKKDGTGVDIYPRKEVAAEVLRMLIEVIKKNEPQISKMKLPKIKFN